MYTILVIEDEESIRSFITINLKREGYHVLEADNGEEGLSIAREHPEISIILLDIMLPGMDGFEVCKHIRAQNESVGIIMLTAKVQEVDRVQGLITGADDYVNKPFSPKELLARIKSLIRRVNMLTKKISQPNNVNNNLFMELFPQKKQVKKGDQLIDLTPTEFALLKLLIENKEQPFNRNDLLDEVWGLDYPGDTKIVDVNIRRLRQKIEKDPSHPTLISTVWGYGYQWSDKEI
ncbi:response regulator transcription factor [Cytobacillus sp. IB215316]|uniref:response regulator transcription factor n=1 Tax=Cytobacillus sp. IB215316 TaxID=3097354 RepID=UPI002A12A253|nr:response regulator transcription factor [Cytobacillus sp. IB215316]MDX8362085.1 response regulator transcription factor [Cytobacillus sp. IB215316]